MLRMVVPKTDFYDEQQEVFIYEEERTIEMEHSLLSVSKWESYTKKPFPFSSLQDMFADVNAYRSELILYAQCMTLTKDVPKYVYYAFGPKQFREIEAYLDDPMSATTIKTIPGATGSRRGRIITSELIYYWMISLQIPFECEKWNLNRLLMLIRVCEAEGGAKKKMPLNEILRQNSELNAKRSKYFRH